jgi:hypothetical protein
MDTNSVNQFIDAEIARLEQVKALLNCNNIRVTKAGRHKSKPAAAHSFEFGKNLAPTPKRRQMSPEGRARIAAAQRARSAKAKK